MGDNNRAGPGRTFPFHLLVLCSFCINIERYSMHKMKIYGLTMQKKYNTLAKE